MHEIMRLVDSDERSLDARVQAALTTIAGQVAVSRFTLWYTTRPPVHLAVVLSLNPPIGGSRLSGTPAG